MRFHVKRWRLLVVALITAFAVCISSSLAFANEPGEWNNWAPEEANGLQVQTSDTVSEAYDAHGNFIDVWRGYTNNQVWVAYRNGQPFTIGGTDTLVAPRVVYYPGSDRFYIFHTGIEGNIYYSWAQAAVAQNPNSWSGWSTLVGNTTNQSVSLAASPDGMMVAYRGSGNDTRLWAVWLDRASGVWGLPRAMGAQSNSAPVITYNPFYSRFYVVFRGLNDDSIYYGYQPLGTPDWGGWWQIAGLSTDSSPVIASTAAGNMLISARDYNGYLWFNELSNAGQIVGWSQETQHYQTDYSPFLSYVAGALYIIIRGRDFGNAYYKRAFTG